MRRRIVTVNDKMQRGYRYELVAPAGRSFDPAFRPELTPKRMLELGVFCGKYLTDCRGEFPASCFARAKLSPAGRDCSLNYFGVDASQPLSEWQRKGWIHADDPRGWFQQIFLDYARYSAVLKWLTLSLFAYVAALAVTDVQWTEALTGIAVPRVEWNAAFLTTLVAILGTTISPYLFFWQASQEAEEQRIDDDKEPLVKSDSDADGEFRRIRIDTVIGMAFSSLIALSIIIIAAATLHASGKTDIETSAQAAEALRPIAGAFAEYIFAAGIIGTGLLAIPVLAGSAAYAIGEGRRWPVGLARKPREATAFYMVLALSAGIGILLNFTPISPIAALYWSAVINGVLAVPVMVLLMFLARRRDVMSSFVIGGPLYAMGWLSTAAMAACVVAMAVGYFV